MNIDRIDQVIASIKGEIERTHELGFHMGTILSPPENGFPDQSPRHCGTVACIAGHAFALSDKRRNPVLTARCVGLRHLDPVSVALEWLGLSENTGEQLFFALNSPVELNVIKPEQAIAVLENLKATGEVNWAIIETEEQY